MNYTHPQLLKLIETGIPVETAIFQSAVNNGKNVPENQFSMRSDNASRRAEMWLTSANILVFKHADCLGFTPLANVKGGVFKADDTTEAKEQAVSVSPIKRRNRPVKATEQ